MNYLIDKSFERDVKKIKDKSIKRKLATVIEKVEKAKRIYDIDNCKKLRKGKNAYRIKIGNYRAGFFYENKTVIFIRFLNRKDIYREFP